MARSALTLAASVAAALPSATVTGVRLLTEDASGRFDSAIAALEDGRLLVVRMPVDDEADSELQTEVRALRALTAGVRGVLPFRAPDVVGEISIDDRSTIVQTLLPGYRVDAAHVPEGRGVATALADALARVHDLPVAVIRDAGLPVRTAQQARDEAERVLDRAEATGVLPFGLLRRWSTALGDDALWRFETTVTLGGVDASSFVLEDDAQDMPAVTGLLSWGGLSVGDAALDLRWTASNPAAREEFVRAYTARSHRAPDALLAARARLYAELEFAKWLVHGTTAGDESIVADASGLLASLEESVRDEPALASQTYSANDALTASNRVPIATPVDTSMRTDAFSADDMAVLYDGDAPTAAHSTTPIDMSDWNTTAPPPAESATPVPWPPGAHDDTHAGDTGEIDAAAQNALRRWSESA